jgi:hypothetical protein
MQGYVSDIARVSIAVAEKHLENQLPDIARKVLKEALDLYDQPGIA